jgi:hypothetical protein
VTEPTTPVVAGYTFGTPTFTDTSGTANDGIVTIPNAQDATVTVTTNNTITQNTGGLVLSKVLTGSGYTGSFTIHYDCGLGHTSDATVTPGTDVTITGIPSGTSCTVTEPTTPVVAGYTFGTPTFTDTSGTANDGIVTIPNAQDATVKVTTNNTIVRDTGSLILAKALSGGPTGYTGSFTIHYNCGTGHTGSVIVSNGSSATVNGIPTSTSCTVTEPTLPTPPTGYTFGTPTFTDTSGTANDGIVTIPDSNGSSVTVTTNNSLHTGHVKVIKTLNGLALTGTTAFTFELRSGASGPSTAGTLLETQVLNASNSATGVTFATNLAPGSHYQLCEIVDVGWTTSLPNQFNLTIALVNDHICTDFIAPSDATTTFTVNNTPPPGGGARTIGYWKNHSSCKTSNGKQSPILDQTLATFPIATGQSTHGFYVGTLYVDTCAKAYSLLNKTTLTNQKSASDPAWNFASQYTAYLLNIQAGAAPNATAAAAAAEGQAILVAINFNGNTHSNISKADAATLNKDAGILDKYNNNLLP